VWIPGACSSPAKTEVPGDWRRTAAPDTTQAGLTGQDKRRQDEHIYLDESDQIQLCLVSDFFVFGPRPMW